MNGEHQLARFKAAAVAEAAKNQAQYFASWRWREYRALVGYYHGAQRWILFGPRLTLRDASMKARKIISTWDDPRAIHLAVLADLSRDCSELAALARKCEAADGGMISLTKDQLNLCRFETNNAAGGKK